MTKTPTIEVTISLSAPDLNDQELQAEVENLLPQIREVDGVEEANLVTVKEAPDRAKGDGFIVGTIKAVVVPGSMALFNFLKERLSGTPIEIALKKAPDSQEIKIKVRSHADFELAYQKAQEFFKS